MGFGAGARDRRLMVEREFQPSRVSGLATSASYETLVPTRRVHGRRRARPGRGSLVAPQKRASGGVQ